MSPLGHCGLVQPKKLLRVLACGGPCKRRYCPPRIQGLLTGELCPDDVAHLMGNSCRGIPSTPHLTELLKQGWTLAKKTVLKLMRTLGLACKVRRRKPYNSYQGEQALSRLTC